MIRRRIGLAIAVGGALSAMTGSAQAAAGDIYIADDGDVQEVIKIDPSTGVQSLFASGGLLADVRDLVVAPNGDLIVADAGEPPFPPRVIRITPDGTQSVIATGPPQGGSRGLAYGPSGDLFLADHGPAEDAPVDGQVLKVTAAGAVSVLASGVNLNDPNGIAVGADEDALVAESGPTGTGVGNPADGKVVRVDTNTGAQTLITAGLLNPTGLALVPGGSAYVTDNGQLADGFDGLLNRVDPRTGAATAIAVGGNLNNPQQLEMDAAGFAVVADAGDDLGSATLDGSVFKVDPKTGGQVLVAAGILLNTPRGIAIEPPKCGGKLATMVGTPDKDKFKGSSFNDVIHAGRGNDKINGRGGNDVICGSNGKDKLGGGGGKDRLVGGKDDDKLSGGKGKDVFKGGKGDDKITQ